MVIGEPGVGKTAVAEGLAQRIVSNDVPEALQGRSLFALDMGSLIAGVWGKCGRKYGRNVCGESVGWCVALQGRSLFALEMGSLIAGVWGKCAREV